MSVYGRNFGHTDADPIVFIGRSACTSTFYFSDSIIMCIVPPGGGLRLPVTVSVGAQHALASQAVFDYESPVVTSVTPSIGPSYGGSVLTVFGSGFGSSADGAAVFVGGEVCEASSWVSDTQMLCVSPRLALQSSSEAEEEASGGAGAGLAVTVHVFNQTSRSSAAFEASAEAVSPTEFNPGFGHPSKQKRGPFYVSVAYILAIALAVAALLLGRHLLRRPAPSSMLSSYTGVRASARVVTSSLIHIMHISSPPPSAPPLSLRCRCRSRTATPASLFVLPTSGRRRSCASWPDLRSRASRVSRRTRAAGCCAARGCRRKLLPAECWGARGRRDTGGLPRSLQTI